MGETEERQDPDQHLFALVAHRVNVRSVVRDVFAVDRDVFQHQDHPMRATDGSDNGRHIVESDRYRLGAGVDELHCTIRRADAL